MNEDEVDRDNERRRISRVELSNEDHIKTIFKIHDEAELSDEDRTENTFES
jgi:hypothetical protein